MSPELTPLQVFGAQASRLVADLLAERGVRFIGDLIPRASSAEGRSHLAPVEPGG